MKESEDSSCLLSIMTWFVFLIGALIIGLIIFPLTEECRMGRILLRRGLGPFVLLLYCEYSYIVKRWLKNTFFKSKD